MLSRLLDLIPGVGPASAALRFLTSTVGVAILAATIGFGAGYQIADHQADLRSASAETRIVRKDLDITKGADGLSRRQDAGLEARLKNNQDRIRALESELRKRPASCDGGLSAGDAQRLLLIR